MLDHDPDEARENPNAGPAATAEPEEEASGAASEVTVEVAQDPGAPRLSDEKLAEYVAAGTPTEDEVRKYNKQAQKRVLALRTAFSEQRRRADQFANDAITASNLAERLYRENEELKGKVTRSESALVDQALARAEAQLKHASTTYRNALTSNDADLITAANVDVARATAEIDRLKLLKPAVGQHPTGGTGGEPAHPDPGPAAGAPPARRPVSERTKAWVAANPWFDRDKEMTDFAMKQHQHLAIDGITEDTNPDLYFRTIEERMAKQFPDRFQARGAEPRPTRPAAGTGGTRTSGAQATPQNGRVTVRLTESQVRLANRLGLTPEQYAKQLIEEEKEKGRVQ